MNTCAGCKTWFNTHNWIVGGRSYCSPWCERNPGKKPELMKKILGR